jgi:hypothetical protein
MAPQWCDPGLWPFQQDLAAPLELQRPAQYLGALYNVVRKSDAYTLRSRFYAELFHFFSKGRGPLEEVQWDLVRCLDGDLLSGWISSYLAPN